MVLPGLSLFDEALQDVFGANAAHATLRNVSGFEDPQQVALLQSLREEAERPVASRLFVQGVAALIARNTTEPGHCRQCSRLLQPQSLRPCISQAHRSFPKRLPAPASGLCWPQIGLDKAAAKDLVQALRIVHSAKQSDSLPRRVTIDIGRSQSGQQIGDQY